MGYGWIKKGRDKFIPCNTRRAHLNINGAITIHDLDVITRQFETVNANATCDFLRSIKTKNLAENKITVVLIILDTIKVKRPQAWPWT